MPFTSDEQRKAAFANMRRRGGGGSGRSNYGGRGGTTPKPPKAPKTPKTPKTPRPPNSSYEGSGNGYAGNFTAGLPSYANWYKSLPNTTQMPALAPSGPWSIQGSDGLPDFYGDFLTAEEFYKLRSEDQYFYSMVYDIMVRQRNPYTGAFQPPLGTPGQFTVGSMLLFELPSDLVSLESTTYGGYASIHDAMAQGSDMHPVGIYGLLTPRGNTTNYTDSVYSEYLRNIGMIP